jgi:hypothetical protein
MLSGQAPRQHTNHLVLDFLVLSGCQEAAVQFAQEAHLDVDLRGMADREEARGLLLAGDVPGCLCLLVRRYPSALEADPLLEFDLHAQHFVELLVAGAEAETEIEEGLGSGSIAALLFAREQLLPLALRDRLLLPALELLLRLAALSSCEHVQLVHACSSSSTGADPALPTHLCCLKEAMDAQRRVDLAARVNQAILRSRGARCKPELPGVLRSVGRLQQLHQQRFPAAGGGDRPVVAGITGRQANKPPASSGGGV